MLLRTPVFALAWTLCLALAAPMRAEEFVLKDGNRIVGKIVGYEKNAFRVETSFGIAIIYKDKITRINMEGTSAASATPSPPAPATPAPAATESAKRPAAVEPAPPPVPAEVVTGTEYVNNIYGFRLFKPPTWRSYPEMVKPQTPLVAALGTSDESTLLLIGRERYRGNLADYAQLAERSLRQFYEDYRKQNERATSVAGMPAIERNFTGSAEGRFWTGVAVYLSQGEQHFTLIGLLATSETTSFEQAVLRKVFNSMEFLPANSSP
jgi:hypothetical protein